MSCLLIRVKLGLLLVGLKALANNQNYFLPRLKEKLKITFGSWKRFLETHLLCASWPSGTAAPESATPSVALPLSTCLGEPAHPTLLQHRHP